MKFFRALLLSAVAIVASACVTTTPPYRAAPADGWAANRIQPTPPMKEVASEAVKAKLLDPQSALFQYSRTFKSAENKFVFCGTVNAKNTYGGYAGDRWFNVEIMKYIDNKGDERYVQLGAIIADLARPDLFVALFPECLVK